MKDAESYFPEPSERVGGKISNAWAWHQVRAQPRSPSTRVGTHLSLRDRMHPVLEHATAAAFTRGADTGLWLLVQRPGPPHARADLVLGRHRVRALPPLEFACLLTTFRHPQMDVAHMTANARWRMAA